MSNCPEERISEEKKRNQMDSALMFICRSDPALPWGYLQSENHVVVVIVVVIVVMIVYYIEVAATSTRVGYSLVLSSMLAPSPPLPPFFFSFLPFPLIIHSIPRTIQQLSVRPINSRWLGQAGREGKATLARTVLVHDGQPDL